MNLTLSGQSPAVLDPLHTIPIKGDYDPLPAIRKTIVEPLFVPMIAGGTVSLVDDQNNPLDEDDMLHTFLSAVGPDINLPAEKTVKGVLQQALINYDENSPLIVNELFTVQAAHQHKLPHPSNRTIYTASHDVIPSAKKLIAGQTPANGSEFFASVALTYQPEALGFWFKSTAAYEDFTTWLTQQISNLANVLPTNTTQLLAKLAQTKLKLVEGYILRATDDDENHEFSFARTIVHLLMQYHEQQQTAGTNETGLMPFVVSELFLPRTILFANIEAHARATPRRVDTEWRLIRAAISSPVKIISNKALSNLTALPRAMAKAAAQAATAQSNKRALNGRSAKIHFKKQPPTTVEIERDLLRVLKRMKEVNRSQNVIKRSKTSYAKPNRRDPMDYNKPGKIMSTHYLPDLHIYIDTSGSISESNYQQAVLMLIKLAKKLNVNLYFNSFSHNLSQEVMLKTKDKSINQIWNEFRNIPKVSGGTDYKQIWDYINPSKTRKDRLSLVVTDFEWTPRSHREVHPKNLYYAPCGNMNWDSILHEAKTYVDAMQHIEPAIAQRLIGLVV